MVTAAEAIKVMKESGKPVIGCLPLYPPLELLHSMGLAPVVLWGLRDSVSHTGDADAHIQKYVCSIARHLAQFVMARGAEGLDGILSYNACDTLRNLPEILREGLAASGASLPMFRLHVPMTSAAVNGDFLRGELLDLIAALEERYGVRFSEDSFASSVALYRRARDLSLRLEEAARAGSLAIGAFCGIMTRAGSLFVEDQIELFEAKLASLRPAAEPDPSCAVILSGVMAPLPQVCRLLDEAGLRLAANDIASLRRSYAQEPFAFNDVADYYTRFYRDHFPCTTLLHSADRRLDAVSRLARDSGARGLIFIGEKFCEYEYFELPHLIARLQGEGVPGLALEFSLDDDSNLETYRTRIEAFAEMLRAGGEKTCESAGGGKSGA
ncbi:MAG: 2-hydroxyacyl-CoA dehydratase subunit D [Candidatus Geothermincolia bacterium]